MATTSLWRVSGRLDHVLRYVENPEKTTRDDLERVLSYAAAQRKTSHASNENLPTLRQLVTGINCAPATALAEMQDVKLCFGKTDGTLAYHGYQSFAPGEATPELAHEIGVKLARRLWGDKYQVIVATHLDKENHLHSHFVINSVAFLDGRKFYRSAQDYARMREASDALCREYGLSVIADKESKTKNYAEWQTERDGQPTIRSQIRADIDRAVAASSTERMFYKTLREMGYDIRFLTESGAELKYPKLKPPGAKGYFRFHKLGEGYTPEEIAGRIAQNYYRALPFSKAERAAGNEARLRAHQAVAHRKAKGLYALYLYYCYELHILQRHPASVKRVPFSMHEDIVKLERLDRQTRFLAEHGIETDAQLQTYQTAAQSEIDALTVERQGLRNELRRLKRRNAPDGEAIAVSERISDLSQSLKILREEVALCAEIEDRTERIRQNLLELRQETERKENEHEHIRRRGGTGREDDPERR